MSRWYRAYEGLCTDPKLSEVAFLSECSRSIVIATWHAILESAAETQDNGRFETSPRRVAAILGEPVDTIQAVFDGFSELHMIWAGEVTAWKKRQFESDSSTERVRRHRAALRIVSETAGNADETFQKQDGTPPYTDTDTEKDKSLSEGKPLRETLFGSEEKTQPKVKKSPKYSAEFETRFWQPYPRTPAMSKVQAWTEWLKLTDEDRKLAIEGIQGLLAYCRSKPDYPVVHACRYLSQRRFDGFSKPVEQKSEFDRPNYAPPTPTPFMFVDPETEVGKLCASTYKDHSGRWPNQDDRGMWVPVYIVDDVKAYLEQRGTLQ